MRRSCLPSGTEDGRPNEAQARDRLWRSDPVRFSIESAFIALIALAFIAALLAMVAYAHGQPVSSADIRVIDGDTIALKGWSQHVRLVGFNAPETDNARCEAEAQLGQRAKQRLQGLVSIGSLELTFIACSCPPGTEATQRCNHGRRCDRSPAGRLRCRSPA